MRYLTWLRNQSTILLFLITSLGCTTAYHADQYPAYQRVNTDLLEQNRSKTFKLGVVKAIGTTNVAPIFASFGLEHKKRALENIPIDEIGSLLSSRYSITVDTTADKTPRNVKEGCDAPLLVIKHSKDNDLIFLGDRIYAWTDNVYYGNLMYETVSPMGTILRGDCPQIINNMDFPNLINVTYAFNYESTETFYYDINISSSGQDILTMHGIAGRVAITDNLEDRWKSYADHAAGITEAVKRDLLETTDVKPF